MADPLAGSSSSPAPNLREILRVMVVADDPLARMGLALLLEEAGAAVVGRDAGDAVIAAAEAYAPDCVVWDAALATEGLESLSERLAELAERGLPTVLLLPDDVDARALLALGVRGLLPRSVEARALAAALEAVMEGLIVIDPALSEGAALEPALPEGFRPDPLTPREAEVLELLAEGLANKAIARRLGVSESTVKFHLAAVLGKLGARSRTEAVARAARLGLILF